MAVGQDDLGNGRRWDAGSFEVLRKLSRRGLVARAGARVDQDHIGLATDHRDSVHELELFAGLSGCVQGGFALGGRRVRRHEEARWKEEVAVAYDQSLEAA